MNKKILTISLAVLVLCATAIARVPSGDEANMTFSSVSSGAKLDLYNGGQSKINIPETHGGADVTTISATAFADPAIEMIYLPITTTTVEENAFLNCGDDVIVILELTDPLADVPKDVDKWGMGDYTAEIRHFTDTGRTDLFIVKGEIDDHECVNICHDMVSQLIDRAGIVGGSFETITYIKEADYPDVVVPEDATDISMVEDGECVFIWLDGTDVKIWFECDELIMPEVMSEYFGFLWDIDTINNLHYLNTSDTTAMSMMFLCTWINVLDMSGFDTSNVTTMFGMFDHGSVYEELNVSTWDVRNVVDMNNMFTHADMPKVIDLSSFDFSHSPGVSGMMSCYVTDTVYVKTEADKDYLNNYGGVYSGVDIIIGTP